MLKFLRLGGRGSRAVVADATEV
jgi:uncharacterized membrane protein YeaQ/YmgE (transglycosylase-associated protein family)